MRANLIRGRLKNKTLRLA